MPFHGSETILCDAVMMDTCQYPFVKTDRMYSTKSEPSCKLWTLVSGQFGCIGIGVSVVL